MKPAPDDGLIERQRAIYDDEAQLIASAQSAIRELESLFDSDMTTAKKEKSRKRKPKREKKRPRPKKQLTKQIVAQHTAW